MCCNYQQIYQQKYKNISIGTRLRCNLSKKNNEERDCIYLNPYWKSEMGMTLPRIYATYYSRIKMIWYLFWKTSLRWTILLDSEHIDNRAISWSTSIVQSTPYLNLRNKRCMKYLIFKNNSFTLMSTLLRIQFLFLYGYIFWQLQTIH